MKKIRLSKVGFFLAAGGSLAAPLAVVACDSQSGQAADAEPSGAAHVFADSFYTNPPVLLDLAQVTSATQLEVLPSMTDYFNSPLVVGAYNEQREFYTTLSTDAYHYGMDLLAPAGTPVLAPYAGDVLYAVYVNENKALVTANEGIGGIIVLRVKVSDMTNLTADEKKALLLRLNNDGDTKRTERKTVDYVYIQFMHMARSVALLGGGGSKTANATSTITYDIAQEISPTHPLSVQAGTVLGQVGTVEENGGWAPHAHVQLMNPAMESFRVDATGTIVPDGGIIRILYGTLASLSFRVVGVGPRSNIVNGTILDANMVLKLLQVKDAPVAPPAPISYTTTYKVIDETKSDNLEFSQPFTLGTSSLPTIAKANLPAGPATFGDWSAPSFVDSAGKPLKTAAGLTEGAVFKAVYTKTQTAAPSGSYSLTITYTVINPAAPASLTASYFIAKNTSALPYLPQFFAGQRPWSWPLFNGDDYAPVTSSALRALTAGTSFVVVSTSASTLPDSVYSIPPKISYVTSITVVDPEAAADLSYVQPYPVGSSDMPVINDLPAAAGFFGWSSPGYADASGKPISSTAGMAVGSKFTAVYSRASTTDSSKVSHLTVTYTVVDPVGGKDFAATYFFFKGQKVVDPFPANVFKTVAGRQPWVGPVYIRGANSVFLPSDLGQLAVGGTVNVVYTSSASLVNETALVPTKTT